MKSLPTQHIFTKGLLLVAVFSIAATGVFASSAILGQQYPFLAFAQQELGVTDTTDTDTTTTTTTTTDNATEGTTTTAADTATTGTNKVAGIIASLQLAPDRLAPEWVTAGYWELESDMPLFGAAGTTAETRPTVTNFDAIVEMVHLADGTALHSHTFSDFRQQDIVSAAENTTTITGTMTVTLQEGPVQNVPVFITLQNNLLSIAMDPAATENHFGPTPIQGIILAPEHLQEISNRLAPTAAEGGGVGEGGTETTTAGQQEEDSASMVTGPTGSLTGQ
ncbi:MAG: hypothetical protein ICV82_09270 [Nitrososphaera sp.]|nr:hypothetical protein [Nitrososphaera sp.]